MRIVALLVLTLSAISPAHAAGPTDLNCRGRVFVDFAGPGAPCAPAGASWTERPAFSGASSVLPPYLDGYCVYEWSGPSLPTAAEMALLPTGAQADCDIVVGMSLPGGTGKASTVSGLAFGDQELNYLEALDVPTSAPSPGTGTVTVAVVDSWAPSSGGYTPAGNNDHGRAVAGVIDALSCGTLGLSGPCPIMVEPYLALHLEQGLVDLAQGGHLGSQLRLAEQIVQAVSDHALTGGGGHLIVNLSVAWHPDLDVNMPTSTPAALVRGAIEYATCEGAMVVAATGNETRLHASDDGPLSPAAWASESVSCGGPPVPMLYSAGGVDGRDEPLPNARAHATPPLVAPAEHVVAEHTYGGKTHRTEPMTGSSFGAAAFSGVAALLWQLDPSLDAWDIYQLLHTSGVSLGAGADYAWAGAPTPDVARLSVCEAVNLAAGAGLACTPRPAGAAASTALDPATMAAIHAVPSFSFSASYTGTPVGVAGCADPVRVEASGPPSPHLCAAESLPTTIGGPNVSGQPGGHGCDLCVVEPDPSATVLHLAVNPALTADIYPQRLVLYDSAGAQLTAFDVGAASGTTASGATARMRDGVSAGDYFRIELGAMSSGSGAASAVLESVDDAVSPRVTIRDNVTID